MTTALLIFYGLCCLGSITKKLEQDKISRREATFMVFDVLVFAFTIFVIFNLNPR